MIGQMTVSGNLITDIAHYVIGSLDATHLFTLAQNADPEQAYNEIAAATAQASGPNADPAVVAAATTEAQAEFRRQYAQVIANNPLYTDKLPGLPSGPSLSTALWIALAGVVGLFGAAVIAQEVA